jgi:hypothetical protein
LELDDKKPGFFSDVFDASVHHAKWIAKMGGLGYDYLIMANRFVNWCLKKWERAIFFSKKNKSKCKER